MAPQDPRYVPTLNDSMVYVPPVAEVGTEAETMRNVRMSAPQMRSVPENILSFGATLVPYTLDVTSASFGLTEKGEVSDAILSGAPGLQDWMHDNRAALGIGAGVLEIVGTAMIAGRVLKAGTAMNTVLRSIPGAGRIAKLDTAWRRSMVTVRRADMAAAEQGIIGEASLSARVMLRGQVIDRGKLAKRASRLGMFRHGAEGALTEGLLYASSNENEMLYFDDTGANLALASLGIALPAVVGNLMTKHAARRFGSSDRFTRTFNRTLDVGGFDEVLTNPHGKFIVDASDKIAGGKFVPSGQAGKIEANLTQPYIDMTYGWQTDELVVLALGAAAKKSERVRVASRGEAVFNTLVTARETMQTQQLKQVSQGIHSVASQGLMGAKGTKVNPRLDIKIGNHVSHLNQTDPTWMYGAEYIAKASDEGFSADYKNYIQRIDKTIGILEETVRSGRGGEVVAATKALRTYNQHHKNLVPFVAREGELVPLEDAIQFSDSYTNTVIREGSPSTGGSVWTATQDVPRGFATNNGLGITDNGTLVTGIRPDGSKINLKNANLDEMHQWYQASDEAMTAMLKRDEVVVSLPKNPSWFELDFAEELALRSDGSAIVNYPAAMTRESARMESLAQKFEIWSSKGASATHDMALREKLNLPKLRTFERGTTGNDLTPIDKFFESVDSAASIREGAPHEIENVLRDYGRVSDLAHYTKEEIKFTGRSFSFGRAKAADEGSQAIESFLVLKRPADANYFTRDFLENRIANQAADTYNSLSIGTGVVGSVTRSTLGLKAFQSAVKTGSLHDLQIASNWGNVTKQNAIQYTDIAARESEAVLGVIQTRDSVQRAMQGHFEEVISPRSPEVSSTMVKVLDAAGKEVPVSISDVWGVHRTDDVAVQLLDQFISARRGWELLPKTATSADGFTQFPLAMTAQNKSLFKTIYGRELREGDVLSHLPTTAGRVVPVELNRNAMNTLKSFEVVGDVVRKAENQILRSQGMSELASSPHYIPPQNDAGKIINWVVDGRGMAVLKIPANTEQQMSRILTILQQDPTHIINRKGYSIRSSKSVEAYSTLYDRVRGGLDDANIPVLQAQDAVKRKGGALTPFIEHGGFEEVVQIFQNRFTRLGDDILTTLLRPQLQANKTRSAISQMQRRAKFTGKELQSRNIYDMYEAALHGSDTLLSEGSQVGGVYQALESLFDLKLQQADAWFSNISPWTGTKAARASYDRLTEQIAKKMPFDSGEQFAIQKFATKTPLTSRKVVGEVNAFTAGLVLRVFEISHGILNLTGMINTAPSVIRQFTMREGESVAKFEARVGPYAHMYKLADGKALATVDMGKIMHRAYKNAWNRKMLPEYEYMQRQGFLTQEVAEFHRHMASMTKRADANKFITGIKKYSTMLADRSEEFSRSYGHMVGLELADVAGITGRANRHQFAHEVANKMIANYSPTNRPEIFQGAAGSMIGLFQSYMWNYWNRIFRYLETGDMRNLATQVATQSTLFGVATVPGFKQYNDLMNDAQDGKRNPIDAIYDAFGREGGDVITSGVLSTMPKLFGADDGVALYSRGDVNPRLPVISGVPPSMSVMGKFWEGMSQGVDMFRQGHPGFTQQEATEILGNMIVNRPIAGWLDIWAGSNVDTRGQVISNDVSSAMAVTARLIGLRPLSEAKQTESLMMNRRAQELQVAARTRLNRSTRAILRSGNIDKLPDAFVKYLDTGGKPEYAASWMRESIAAATMTRNDREVIRLLKRGDKMEELNRVLRARTGE